MTTNNDHLRALIAGTGLTQDAALARFNRGFGIRGIKMTTWKAYLCRPDTTRFRKFSDEMLKHAEKVFAPRGNAP